MPRSPFTFAFAFTFTFAFAFALAGCKRPTPLAAAPAGVVVLDATKLPELRADFERTADRQRILALLSPS